MPEIFHFQRALRAKTKGSCWLPKLGTCSSISLAEVCYLKLQKTAKNGRFAGAQNLFLGKEIQKKLTAAETLKGTRF